MLLVAIARGRGAVLEAMDEGLRRGCKCGFLLRSTSGDSLACCISRSVYRIKVIGARLVYVTCIRCRAAYCRSVVRVRNPTSARKLPLLTWGASAVCVGPRPGGKFSYGFQSTSRRTHTPNLLTSRPSNRFPIQTPWIKYASYRSSQSLVMRTVRLRRFWQWQKHSSGIKGQPRRRREEAQAHPLVHACIYRDIRPVQKGTGA